MVLIKLLLNGSSNIYSFSGLIFLFLLRPSLKNLKDYKKVGLVSIWLSSAFLFLSVASILFLFPFLTAGKSALSVYLATRTIQFGEILPRTDALQMLIW